MMEEQEPPKPLKLPRKKVGTCGRCHCEGHGKSTAVRCRFHTCYKNSLLPWLERHEVSQEAIALAIVDGNCEHCEVEGHSTKSDLVCKMNTVINFCISSNLHR